MGQRIILGSAIVALAVVFGTTDIAAQKYGGTLNALLGGNPPSLSIHDEATTNTSWPMMPVYNNLVFYDPLVARESLDSIIPELATDWHWSKDANDLTFNLRRGVKFHDGKPFSSKDVKHTFDIVRGASKLKTQLSPRKLWYANVKEIVTNGDYAVTFKLKRPQPSLMAMLASGFSPVYPSHISPRELRIRAVGTGPFSLKEFKRDQVVHVVKNPGYFIKGRPYLDGIRFNIIRKVGTRVAALAAKQLDIDQPPYTPRSVADALKAIAPDIQFVPIVRNSYQNIVFNINKSPFDNVKLRQVVSMAMDREQYSKGITKGAMIPGGFMLIPPMGAWGLPKNKLDDLPGYGDIGKNRAEARRIMASLGYSADRPLKVQMASRTSRFYVDAAIWAADQLKKVWIDVELVQKETAVWYGMLARRNFTMAIQMTGTGADDPDIQFYENFGCGSQRNYSDYCNPALQRRYDAQSQEFDHKKRQQMVWEIDQELVTDVARIIFGFNTYYNPRWPWVKNFVPHQTIFSHGRMQEVWLDR